MRGVCHSLVLFTCCVSRNRHCLHWNRTWFALEQALFALEQALSTLQQGLFAVQQGMEVQGATGDGESKLITVLALDLRASWQ
jgi:hypothetical protein